MSIFKASNLQSLPKFLNRCDPLAALKRKPKKGSDEFFQKLMKTNFKVIGQIFKDSSKNDIKYILKNDIPNELQTHSFYTIWVNDMSIICNIFCRILDIDSVGFSLGTQRVCQRYHIDNVSMRLLVTYAGIGTEWLPENAADRKAYYRGMSNEQILKDPSKRKFMDIWDVAIFRGGPNGLLHRSPDAALKGQSIMMRLDHENFWNTVLKHELDNKVL